MINVEIVLYTAIGFCFIMLLRELVIARKELNKHKRYIRYLEINNLSGNRIIRE